MPAADGGAVKTAIAGKTAVFGDITYSQEGDYYYTITETKGNTVGMTYDNIAKYAKVAVRYNSTQKKYTTTVTYGANQAACDAPNAETSLTVTNTYRKTTYAPVITKLVSGAEAPEGTYAFTISKKQPTTGNRTPDSDVLPTTATATAVVAAVAANDTTATADAEFGAITYTEAGTYSYTITEVKADSTSIPGMTYSEEIVTLKVVVSADETTGALSVVATTGATYTNSNSDDNTGKTFTNTYT